jgi:hypothetical protein
MTVPSMSPLNVQASKPENSATRIGERGSWRSLAFNTSRRDSASTWQLSIVRSWKSRLALMPD